MLRVTETAFVRPDRVDVALIRDKLLSVFARGGEEYVYQIDDPQLTIEALSKVMLRITSTLFVRPESIDAVGVHGPSSYRVLTITVVGKAHPFRVDDESVAEKICRLMEQNYGHQILEKVGGIYKLREEALRGRGSWEPGFRV